MDILIDVSRCRIGEETVNAVNARDLHAFLEVGKDFSNWIKDRISSYGFSEGTDYLVANFGDQLPSGMKYRNTRSPQWNAVTAHRRLLSRFWSLLPGWPSWLNF